MKTKGLLLLLSVSVFYFSTSCKKEEDDHLDRWMISNLMAYNAIKTNPEYKELVSPGKEGSIYYKVLKAGDGTEPIWYTSHVSCYYKGYFIANYPEYKISTGNTFDQRLFDDGPAMTFSITGSNLINGWKTALQHMVKGDVWEIWVPYQLGYGRSGSRNSSTGVVTIPGYSTLVFEVEVVDVFGIDDL